MATNELIIIGIDPGTLTTGYGIIKKRGVAISFLDAGAIRNPASDSMPLRLKHIYTELCRVIEQWRPDEFAIETAFYSKNAQSALKIGHARGVAILAGVLHEIPVSEYSPREIKKSVTGSGAASKIQVQFMIMNLLGMSAKPKQLDVSDALATALCHAHRIGKPRGGFHDWKSFVDAHPERIISSSRKTKRT
ncbi:MAG: crossover junction endodeoxyribonuclease RuvC [Ignavibacteriales bacterium]|nr:crossover junction endodeoxyribonuclease RuvC [Ignavibacteriales bacterium]